MMINLKKIKLSTEIKQGIWWGIIVGILLLLVISLCVPFIPFAYDVIFGANTKDVHAQAVIGNETNSTIIAQKFMIWIRDNTTTPYASRPYLNWIDWSIVNVNNSPKLFIRTSKASWFIVQRLGNCIEDAEYFAEMMNHSGYRSRILVVKGEDHAFAEFYDKDGRKIVVDPSNNLFVNDTLAFGDGKYWSRIEAQDSFGNTEDVTDKYLRNTSVLTVKTSGNEFLAKRIRITVESVFLKTRYPGLYNQPLEVITQAFDQNNTFQVKLGPKKEYQITSSLDLFVINFKSTQALDLTTNRTIELYGEKMVSMNNLEINYVGVFCLILAIAIGYELGKRLSRQHAQK